MDPQRRKGRCAPVVKEHGNGGHRMRTFQAVAVWVMWSVLATVATAQEARCLPVGLGDKALQCTDGRGHYWYADINGVPSGTQQRQPIVYASPLRAEMEGQRAAI